MLNHQDHIHTFETQLTLTLPPLQPTRESLPILRVTEHQMPLLLKDYLSPLPPSDHSLIYSWAYKFAFFFHDETYVFLIIFNLSRHLVFLSVNFCPHAENQGTTQNEKKKKRKIGFLSLLQKQLFINLSSTCWNVLFSWRRGQHCHWPLPALS